MIYQHPKQEYVSVKKKKRGFKRKQRQLQKRLYDVLVNVAKRELENYGIPPLQITTLT